MIGSVGRKTGNPQKTNPPPTQKKTPTNSPGCGRRGHPLLEPKKRFPVLLDRKGPTPLRKGGGGGVTVLKGGERVLLSESRQEHHQMAGKGERSVKREEEGGSQTAKKGILYQRKASSREGGEKENDPFKQEKKGSPLQRRSGNTPQIGSKERKKLTDS